MDLCSGAWKLLSELVCCTRESKDELKLPKSPLRHAGDKLGKQTWGLSFQAEGSEPDRAR